METLTDELNKNGFARNSPFRTLNYVYSNTLQDAQYSSGAHAAAQILAKYTDKYGTFTIEKIYQISQFLKEMKGGGGGTMDFYVKWEKFILEHTGIQVDPDSSLEDLTKIGQYLLSAFDFSRVLYKQ